MPELNSSLASLARFVQRKLFALEMWLADREFSNDHDEDGWIPFEQTDDDPLYFSDETASSATVRALLSLNQCGAAIERVEIIWLNIDGETQITTIRG